MLELTEAYVATLWNKAKRDGSAGVLAGQLRRGKPGTVTPAQWEQARQWRAEGVSDAEIGRRLGVAHTTIGRGLGKRQAAAGADGWVADLLPDAGTGCGRRRRPGCAAGAGGTGHAGR